MHGALGRIAAWVAFPISFGNGRTTGVVMPTYRMVYGDAEQIVNETYDNVEVQREDGWVVLFRDGDAILRVQEAHVQSLDIVES
jgi:hypothetical protein